MPSCPSEVSVQSKTLVLLTGIPSEVCRLIAPLRPFVRRVFSEIAYMIYEKAVMILT